MTSKSQSSKPGSQGPVASGLSSKRGPNALLWFWVEGENKDQFKYVRCQHTQREVKPTFTMLHGEITGLKNRNLGQKATR